MRGHHSTSSSLPLWGAGLIVVLVLASLVFSVIGSFNDRTVTCTVQEKTATSGRTSDGTSGGTDYRVYMTTDECGTMAVADNLLRGKFNAADRYRKLEEGGTYEVTVIGWRIPFLSQFPNIIEVSQ